jgi:hypothetical protein
MKDRAAHKTRLIAYYLPQFHPIPENDEHWGKGFTEWTNVAKARPLFKGHYQPSIPTELGYYDLRLPEVRKAQADLAKEYGIEGFCYWHYWMGNGKRLLERPFNEVVKSGEPDFPFCLCWANHTWSRVWTGDGRKIIAEQTYGGVEDYTAHFYELLPAFRDNRYIKVQGQLLFSIFSPREIPDIKLFTLCWQQLAKKEGLPGFHFIGLGISEDEMKVMGLSASTPHTPHHFLNQIPTRLMDKITYRIFGMSWRETKTKWLKIPNIFKYKDFVNANRRRIYCEWEYPAILPNWDHSPRSGIRAIVLQGSTPELFQQIVEHTISSVQTRPYDERIIFVKAWNEWAEGNFLEPELRYGTGYLEVLKNLNSN